MEFVHPVIVGKRALPAIGLSREGGPLTSQAGLIAQPEDIAIGFGTDEPDAAETIEALGLARQRGCQTIAFAPCGAEWEFAPPSEDPFIRQELAETLYHVLWELVGRLLRASGPARRAGGWARPRHRRLQLPLPFLSEGETGLDDVIEDVRANVLRSRGGR